MSLVTLGDERDEGAPVVLASAVEAAASDSLTGMTRVYLRSGVSVLSPRSPEEIATLLDLAEGRPR